jgi:hypothetical protein
MKLFFKVMSMLFIIAASINELLTVKPQTDALIIGLIYAVLSLGEKE